MKDNAADESTLRPRTFTFAERCKMKIPLACVAFLTCAVSIRAEIRFQGFMVSSAGPRFILSIDEERTSAWLAIGQNFGGFAIVAFDAKAELLTVEKDGKPQVLRLSDGKVAAATAEASPSGVAARPIEVAIGAGETIYVGDDAAMLEALKKRFVEAAALVPQPMVTIRAPDPAAMKRLGAILDLGRKAGLALISINTR